MYSYRYKFDGKFLKMDNNFALLPKAYLCFSLSETSIIFCFLFILYQPLDYGAERWQN